MEYFNWNLIKNNWFKAEEEQDILKAKISF